MKELFQEGHTLIVAPVRMRSLLWGELRMMKEHNDSLILNEKNRTVLHSAGIIHIKFWEQSYEVIEGRRWDQTFTIGAPESRTNVWVSCLRAMTKDHKVKVLQVHKKRKR